MDGVDLINVIVLLLLPKIKICGGKQTLQRDDLAKDERIGEDIGEQKMKLLCCHTACKNVYRIK